jgi:hypothetical protein
MEVLKIGREARVEEEDGWLLALRVCDQAPPRPNPMFRALGVFCLAYDIACVNSAARFLPESGARRVLQTLFGTSTSDLGFQNMPKSLLWLKHEQYPLSCALLHL